MKAEKASNLPRTARGRTIANARRAIADFVETNVPRFNNWLDQVAEGIPKRDADGRKILDAQGSIVYLVKPDPATAMKLVGDLTEYHLPRLTRSDVEVVAKIEQTGPFDPSQMTSEELKRFIAAKMLEYDRGSVIDVEHERESTFAERQTDRPDWLK